jgi:cation diffusion facilitator family transporter
MTRPHDYQGDHTHVFDEGNPLAERNTMRAVILTAVVMVVEIIGGWLFNSMALLADGWHMASHALALGLSVAAYAAARKLAGHAHFSFGTWKIEVLGGYTSAIFLMGVAVMMMFESVLRFITPTPIQYDQAIAIAFLGLATNLVSAWLLKDGHHHGHDHGHGNDDHHHDHDHEHDHQHVHGHDDNPKRQAQDKQGHHHDLNLRSAYMHVVTDAATSVLAIIALFSGKWWAWDWMDPLMGVVGAVLVAVWAFGLIRDSGRILLDAEMNAPVVQEIKDVIQKLPVGATITDLHVGRVGKGKFACILAVSVRDMVEPAYFKQALSVHEELVHITVEVNRVG